MGKTVENKPTKKKKKGRPSLLDLQKRNLKEQQFLKKQKNKIHKKIPNSQNPNPNLNSTRRSTRRNPNPNSDEDVSSSGNKRREKKLNLVLNLPNDNDEDHNSRSLSDDSSGSNPRKRKIHSISSGSSLKDIIKGEKHSADPTKQSNTQQGGASNLDDNGPVGPSTSLPDKSLLLFILDRLQKKDTYGVFAEPVDPEELPDYHEVIEHPMDFSTVRKKLEKGAYATLEDFEKDVYLICSNAMQYNAPDTVYFRQARSIQELAKRNFDNLRADSDADDNGTEQDRERESGPEPKVVRRGRPPTKNFKRPPGRPPLERATSNFSEPTIVNSGGSANRSNETRKSSLTDKYGSSDSLARSLYGTRYGEAYLGWSTERLERADDITGSASKGFSTKYGKKNIVLDESRRNTYMHSCALACGQELSVLTTFNRERKQLIAVGLHTEYGYARSLARFAAKIGPLAWKVASKRIERCLPPGVKFGPGWIGENEAPPEKSTQKDSPSSPTEINVDGSSQKPQVDQLPKPCTESKAKELRNGDGPNLGSGPNIIAPEACANNGTASSRQGNPYPAHQTSTVQSHINGLNGTYGVNLAGPMGKMIGPGRPTMYNLQSPDNKGSSEAKLGNNYNNNNNSTIKSMDGLPNKGSGQNGGPSPPDLNVGFQSPGSPASGKAEGVHPDLALQL